MKHNLIVFSILVIGITMRLYQWQNFPLAFDQVQILTNAENILHGKITLIGPRTGPAPIFTGPLIYYWTAAWMIVFHAPYTLVGSTIMLQLLTGVTSYYLFRRYYGKGTALFALLLWSISAYLIRLDRIPWNPNLCFFAAACVFIPISSLIKTQTTRLKDVLIISLGIFLGFQAHFSGLFLFPLAVSGLILAKDKNRDHYLYFVGAFALSLLPALLFDLRHQWMHLIGIKTLISSTGTQAIPYYQRAYHDILVSMENGGKFLLYKQTFFIKIITGIAMIISSLMVVKKSRNLRVWFLLWIIGIPLVFGFYGGEKPEYYYSLQLPVWLTLITLIAARGRKATKAAYIVVLVVCNSYSLWGYYRSPQPLSMQDQIDIARYSNAQNPGKIIYFMPHATTTGLEYLIHLEKNSSKTITIEYPKNQNSRYQFETQFIGVKE